MNSYCNVVLYWNLESYKRVLSMPNMHGYVSDMSCEFGLESMQHSYDLPIDNSMFFSCKNQ